MSKMSKIIHELIINKLWDTYPDTGGQSGVAAQSQHIDGTGQGESGQPK